MLRQRISDALNSHFASNFVASSNAEVIATFPAKHPTIGDVEVVDDGTEIRVDIGRITHSHFGSYDEGLSEAEHENAIVNEVIDFLEDLFADRCVLYKSPRECGSAHIDYFRESMERSVGTEYYVWSGPI